jgi:hypothetical protein
MMDRPLRPLALLTLLGLALSIWLIVYGLQLRFFGTFLSAQGIRVLFVPPDHLLTWASRLNPEASAVNMGWPLVVVGSSLLGSIASLWMRQRWAAPSLILFAAASLITFHWMNLLSLLLILIVRSKAIQGWVSSGSTADE